MTTRLMQCSYCHHETVAHALTDGPVGVIVMPPKRPTKSFCFAKTDFRTNWPTLQIMVMQKGVQLQGRLRPSDPLTRGSPPGRPTGALPQTPIQHPHKRSLLIYIIYSINREAAHSGTLALRDER